jgi:hypothetical protein
MASQPIFDFDAVPTPAPVRGPALKSVPRLEPSWQGQYDGFCGIYAIINAMRLVLAPIAPLQTEDCEKLFGFGVRLLDKRGELAGCAQDGLDLTSWVPVAQQIAGCVERYSRFTVTVRQPFGADDRVSITDLLRTIETTLDRGEVVSLSLLGAYDHYTVVQACSASRLRLFDSYGYAWLNIAACDVAQPGSKARHQIEAASLLAFGVVERQLSEVELGRELAS